MVTTRTVDSTASYKGVDFTFRPASLYAYTLGVNLLGEINSA